MLIFLKKDILTGQPNIKLAHKINNSSGWDEWFLCFLVSFPALDVTLIEVERMVQNDVCATMINIK